LNAMHENMLP